MEEKEGERRVEGRGRGEERKARRKSVRSRKEVAGKRWSWE